MTRSEVIERLKTSSVFLEFEKSDGSRRVMYATLHPDFIVESSSTKEKKTKNENTLPIWDLDLSEWRSFRFDRLRMFDNIVLPKGL